MKKNNTFRRAAALVAALSITVSLAAPAFAGTYYIDDGGITIIKNENGSQTIKQQGKEDCTDQVGDETIITTHKKAITTLESDLEGPAAEDSGFGPVVEDNYQPAPRPSRRTLRSRRTPTSRRTTTRRTLRSRRTTRSRKTPTGRRTLTGRRALRNRKTPTGRKAPGSRPSPSRQPRLLLPLQPLQPRLR